MITKEDSEERCLAFINDYLKAAVPCSAEDIANLLMKLISAAGLTMYEVVGQEETMSRMIRTAAFCCRLSESRLVFYAGASALFTMLMSESSGAHTLDSVYSELKAIQSEVAARALNVSPAHKTKH